MKQDSTEIQILRLLNRLVQAAERIADSLEAEQMDDPDGPQLGSLSDVPR